MVPPNPFKVLQTRRHSLRFAHHDLVRRRKETRNDRRDLTRAVCAEHFHSLGTYLGKTFAKVAGTEFLLAYDEEK
jgi:hypothetical protein